MTFPTFALAMPLPSSTIQKQEYSLGTAAWLTQPAGNTQHKVHLETSATCIIIEESQEPLVDLIKWCFRIFLLQDYSFLEWALGIISSDNIHPTSAYSLSYPNYESMLTPSHLFSWRTKNKILVSITHENMTLLEMVWEQMQLYKHYSHFYVS